MSGHTPTPWRTTVGNRRRIVGSNGYHVATAVLRGNARDPMGEKGGDEAEANARLIAAAPDLFAALKETLAVATRNEEGEFADRARAAIAKATAP